MSFIKDTFFGGNEKRAAEKQTEALRASQEFVEKGINEAKGEVKAAFPEAQKTLQQGFQGALDVWKEATPAQLEAYTQGNMNAQNTMYNAMPQIQNAILGAPVNFSQFAPTRHRPDTGFLNQSINFGGPVDLPNPQQPTFTFPAFPGGFGGGFSPNYNNGFGRKNLS